MRSDASDFQSLSLAPSSRHMDTLEPSQVKQVVSLTTKCSSSSSGLRPSKEASIYIAIALSEPKGLYMKFVKVFYIYSSNKLCNCTNMAIMDLCKCKVLK